jgi:putative ABC transport system permease protein
MSGVLQDARYALRQLRKSPGFTLVAVLTLALGIGGNTAVFSLVDGILLLPLPYSKPNQLVSVTGSYPAGALVAMREQLHTMDVGAYAEGHDFNLTGLGEPVRLTGTLVSAELLSVLGARPELGRTFYPGEDSAGHRMFQSHVGALFPWPMPASWNADVNVVHLQNGMVADVSARLLMLLGAVLLILLIACANVANLTLSRAATREKEIAIRSALGAVPRRIARQLLTESVMLASLGGLLGLVLATIGLRLLEGALPADTPRLAEVHMDWRVLAFTGGLTILTGFSFGLAPALQSSRAALADSLNSAGRGASISVSQRLRSSLAVVEVAFAVLLVIAAGLLIRSFWTLSHVNPGFRFEQVVTARITPNESFCSDPARCLTFYRGVLDQAKASPGVSGAALVNTLPLGGRVSKRSLEIEDFTVSADQVLPLFWLDVVTPEYFRVMGIPLLSGRWFADADESGNAPVAVMTASSAQRFWPGRNAVGQHVRFARDNEWRTVVGVVADVRAYDLQRNTPDWIKGTVYVPYNPKATLEAGGVPAEMTIAVRTTLDEAQTGAVLRRVVIGLKPRGPGE